jgi:outer membrane protein
MKNALLIVNVVLVIAVGTLFFLYFSKATSAKIGAAVVTGQELNDPAPEFKIAYFEMDSVDNNYLFAKHVRELLRNKRERFQSQLVKMEEEYTNMWNEINSQRASLPEDQLMKKNMALADKEESFKMTKFKLESELQTEDYKYKQEIYKEIETFLKKYSEEKGYAYIFANGLNEDGNFMFFKSKPFDITPDLLAGLNNLYKSKNK